jgi:hypothetical protein
VDVKGEDLGSEGMLGGEFLGAMDPLLPGSLCHRAIIGLSWAAGKSMGLIVGTIYDKKLLTAKAAKKCREGRKEEAEYWVHGIDSGARGGL